MQLNNELISSQSIIINASAEEIWKFSPNCCGTRRTRRAIKDKVVILTSSNL